MRNVCRADTWHYVDSDFLHMLLLTACIQFKNSLTAASPGIIVCTEIIEIGGWIFGHFRIKISKCLDPYLTQGSGGLVWHWVINRVYGYELENKASSGRQPKFFVLFTGRVFCCSQSYLCAKGQNVHVSKKEPCSALGQLGQNWLVSWRLDRETSIIGIDFAQIKSTLGSLQHP